MYKINELVQPDQTVITMRRTVSPEELPNVTGEAYARLFSHIQTQKGEIEGSPFTAFLGVCESHVCNEERIEVEIGFPIKQGIKAARGMKCYTMPASKAVEGTYKGPYDKMDKLYEKMYEWIKENGYEHDGVSYEYSLSGADVPKSEHITSIIMRFK